jgi:Cu+-exporting ATPase
MQLVKMGGVADEAADPEAFVYRCPHDGAERETPGPCPKCGMALDERHKVRRATDEKERAIYVCDGHPEEVYDQPGRCLKGG